MRRLDETTREAVRHLTVFALLDLRTAYLANGASPLKHWDQILDRMRAAARTSASVAEWHSAMLRGLQLGAPTSAACSGLSELQSTVGAASGDFLDLIEREHGLLLAMARLEAERRRDARDAKKDVITMEGES